MCDFVLQAKHSNNTGIKNYEDSLSQAVVSLASTFIGGHLPPPLGFINHGNSFQDG